MDPMSQFGTERAEISESLRGAQLPGLNDETRPPHLTANYIISRWYAAYTCANHEGRVATHLALRSVDCFLPRSQSTRRWKDRRVQLTLPLFPGYVFVHIALRDRLHVLQIPGVVRLVGFSGTPAALHDEQIEALKRTLTNGRFAEPYPYLTAGRHVEVGSGPFRGLKGILLRRKGKFRFVVSIELIQRSVAIDMDGEDLCPSECGVKAPANGT
jgi:transcription antitermination factor NusG